MPNWNTVLKEIAEAVPTGPDESPHDVVRRKYLRELSAKTGRNTLAYYSGFLTKARLDGVEITDDDKNGLMLSFHELDKSRGLDIIMHTPGGNIAATESIVHYISELFGTNVRAIIPQIALSAGTMWACACRTIVMGKHSSLGPIDPQIFGFPAIGVLREFEDATNKIIADPRTAAVWGPILSQLSPSFLKQCEWGVEWAQNFVRESLIKNMLSENPNKEILAQQIVQRLSDLGENKGHDRHFHYQECVGMGLEVELLENDNHLQDLVLTVHHCFMHTLANTMAFKVIENQLGRAYVRQQAPTFMPLPMMNVQPG